MLVKPARTVSREPYW